MSKSSFPKTIDTSVDGVEYTPFIIVSAGEGTLSRLSQTFLTVRDRFAECEALLMSAKNYKFMLSDRPDRKESRQKNFELVKLALQAENDRLQKAWEGLRAERKKVSELLERNLDNILPLGLWITNPEAERIVAESNCDLASGLEHLVAWWECDVLNRSKEYFRNEAHPIDWVRKLGS